MSDAQPGSARSPYVVLISHLALWLRERLGEADPKCPLCLGEGSEECESCDGLGHVECTCADCGDTHDRDCEQCGGTGSIHCDCVDSDDTSFRIEICERVLGYPEARKLLAALGEAKGAYAEVWTDSWSTFVHVEEVSRRQGRVRWLGIARPGVRPAPPRYPVEQPPLPMFGKMPPRQRRAT